ncbi:MAG: hypothetical protein LUO89_13800 [Methanothrix sp.]|nr:hypothetical protein [Methanothrix sp.]
MIHGNFTDLVGEGDVVSETGLRVADIYDAPIISSDLKMRTGYNVKSWQDLSWAVSSAT